MEKAGFLMMQLVYAYAKSRFSHEAAQISSTIFVHILILLSHYVCTLQIVIKNENLGLVSIAKSFGKKSIGFIKSYFASIYLRCGYLLLPVLVPESRT